MNAQLPLTAGLSPLRGFLAWWRAELARLVPQRLRHWYAHAEPLGVIQLDHATATLWRRDAAGLTQLHQLELAALPEDARRTAFQRHLASLPRQALRFLALPQALCLQRTLTLPLAAEENLTQVIRFELDRITPFKPDQVYDGYRITARDASAGQVQLAVCVAPRASLDPLLRQALALGLELHGIAPLEDLTRHGAESPNLLPPAARAPRPRRRRAINTAFALLALLLASAALALPLWQKRATAIALLAPMDQAQRAADAASTRRTALEALTRRHNFATEQKWSHPSPLLVIDELSRLLGDEVWIQVLDLNAQELQLQGEAADPVKLLDLLGHTPFVDSVEFKAPVIQNPGTPVARFHLLARLKPLLPPGAAPAPAAAPESRP